jgi:hypothetical protein
MVRVVTEVTVVALVIVPVKFRPSAFEGNKKNLRKRNKTSTQHHCPRDLTVSQLGIHPDTEHVKPPECRILIEVSLIDLHQQFGANVHSNATTVVRVQRLNATSHFRVVLPLLFHSKTRIIVLVKDNGKQKEAANAARAPLL